MWSFFIQMLRTSVMQQMHIVVRRWLTREADNGNYRPDVPCRLLTHPLTNQAPPSLPCHPVSLFPRLSYSLSPSVNLRRPHIITVKNHTAAPAPNAHTHTHYVTHTQAHKIILCHPLVLTFFCNWLLTLSSELLPKEIWVRQTRSVKSGELGSLILLSDTFSPRGLPKKK